MFAKTEPKFYYYMFRFKSSRRIQEFGVNNVGVVNVEDAGRAARSFSHSGECKIWIETVWIPAIRMKPSATSLWSV